MSQLPPPPINVPGPPDFGASPYQQTAQAEQPARRRAGCGGCLVGCLAGFAVKVVLAALVLNVGAFMLRQAFPTGESFTQAATCTALRTVVYTAESSIDQRDASAAEKAELRQGIQELRAEYERQCGPLR
jgi:hypothetical protein